MHPQHSTETGGSPNYISRGERPGNKTPPSETISQPQPPRSGYLPTPPTSPLKLNRKHPQSGLDLTQSPYPPSKKRWSAPPKDNLPGHTLYNSFLSSKPDMISIPILENEKDHVAKESSPAGQRSSPERVSNNAAAKTPPSIVSSPVGLPTAAPRPHVYGDITGSTGESWGSSSSSQGAPPIPSQRPLKRKRYIEFDELTGREIITERLQHLGSKSSEHTRLVYTVPGASSTALSDNSSEKPLKDLILRTTVYTTGTESKGTICKSPESISQDKSACGSFDEKGDTRITSNTSPPTLIPPEPNSKSEEQNHMRIQDHLMIPTVSQVPTPVTSCSTLPDYTTPLDSTNFLARAVPQEKKPVPSATSYLHLNVENPPVEPQAKESDEATTPKALELVRQVVRRKPPPLPLAAQAGNFGTLAVSRERRQQANLDTNSSIFRAPFLGSPISYKPTKSVPVTPTSDTSRRSSYSRTGNDQADPHFRPLSPVEPVDGAWLSQVPPEVCRKIIDKQVGLFSRNHNGTMPLHCTYGRNRVKGRYRIALETDKPNLQDFIIVSARDGSCCKKNANEAEDEDASVGMDTEEGSSSASAERWSGGNVKGPKRRVLVEHLRKRMVLPGSKLLDTNLSSRAMGNVANPKVSSTVRSKSLSSAIVTRRRRNTYNGLAAIAQAEDGINKLKPLRNLSDDEALVEDPADLNYGPGPKTNVTGSRQINRTTKAFGGPAATAVSILRPRPPKVVPGNYNLQLDILTESLTSATESTISNFTSDTEISSDEDIIPSSSLFGHRTARCASSSTSQSRALRKESQANAIRLTEGGPNGKGFVPGSTSIFSTGQLTAAGAGVMGPPAAKVSPAELRLYIGRRGDHVPLFGKMIPGLGTILPHEYTTGAYDGHSAGTSGLFQSGGTVEVRRVQDPLLEATVEVKRLIFEAGHQAGLVPEEGILGGLLVDKVYWSGVGILLPSGGGNF